MKSARIVEFASATLDAVSRRVPILAGFVRMAIAEWRLLVAEVSRAATGNRRNQIALESEPFGGRCTLSSKTDDGLPAR